MRIRLPYIFALAFATAVTVAPQARADISIPFTKTTLPNGMTVILSEDHSLPLITVNIGYWVGSRFEVPHRTGFAHLFEHLMFMGTERVPTHRFNALVNGAGGWFNAGTTEDRTDFYDVAPAGTLDLLLYLEADRLRDLGRVMTKEKLDTQREVVRNERRFRYENQPYGRVRVRLPELLYPEGHPYHHATIGSHEDLEAATVDDVKQFFATYYDPANASLAIVGDFDSKDAMNKVQAWFATIPSHGKPADPDAPGFDSEKTTLTSVVRETIPDHVELAKTVMAWQSPKSFTEGDADLDLLAEILGRGKESRLYKALVTDKKLAQDVGVHQESKVLSSRFIVDATALPGVSLDALEAAIDAELDAVRKKPVTDAELARAKAGYETAFIGRLESVEERASILNEYQAMVGDPGYAAKDLARYQAATPAKLEAIAARVLDPNARVILRVVPEPKSSDAKHQAPAAKKSGGTK